MWGGKGAGRGASGEMRGGGGVAWRMERGRAMGGARRGRGAGERGRGVGESGEGGVAGRGREPGVMTEVAKRKYDRVWALDAVWKPGRWKNEGAGVTTGYVAPACLLRINTARPSAASATPTVPPTATPMIRPMSAPLLGLAEGGGEASVSMTSSEEGVVGRVTVAGKALTPVMPRAEAVGTIAVTSDWRVPTMALTSSKVGAGCSRAAATEVATGCLSIVWISEGITYRIPVGDTAQLLYWSWSGNCLIITSSERMSGELENDTHACAVAVDSAVLLNTGGHVIIKKSLQGYEDNRLMAVEREVPGQHSQQSYRRHQERTCHSARLGKQEALAL